MDSRLAGNLLKVNKMGITGKQIAIGTGALLGSVLLVAVLRKKSHPLAGMRVISRVRKDGRTMTVLRGNVGIEGRLMLIESKVAAGMKDPSVRTLATQITAPCPREDDECAAKQILQWVSQNVKYVKDAAPIMHEDGTIEPVDMYNGVDYTLKTKAGDCGNQISALGALLGMVGIKSFSRAAGYNPFSSYSHVYRVARIGGRNVALDTTLQPPEYGKEIPPVKVFDFPKI